MNNFEFYSPTKVYFGKNQESRIGEIIKSYNYKNILLVYGMSSIKKIGLYDTVITSLKDANISFYELSGIEPNPKLSKVKEGIKIVKDHNCDLILAVGGGSVIDTAKAIACGSFLDSDPWCLNDHSVKPSKALPVGVILTISAAGSELSNSCVISNDDTHVKSGFNSDLIRPLFAVLNPELTYTVSKYQTACGIVDILMHTLERYLTDVDNLYFTDEVALGVMKSVITSGKIAINNPYDYEARAALMIASSFSHNGLTGLGGNFYFTVHKLEHELSGTYDEIAHGAGLAALYSGWALTVYEKLPHKFARFAKEVMNVENDNELETAKEGILKLKDFFKEIGMPTSFSDFNISKEEYIEMAKRITKNNTVLVPGFVKLNLELVLSIFEKIK
jgi:alcohol dehydrogenase YqhD (iron-dependent ADH family)